MRDYKKIVAYCEKHSTPPSALLLELERETHLKTLTPQMISGHLQGRLLSFISDWIRPRLVLEIGTFTGYGTICLASGLSEGGHIHTIEVNPEWSYISKHFFRKARITKKVVHHIGDAKDIIPRLAGPFDIVYLDAGKREYGLHYELVIEKIRPGGILLADNVLWSGKAGASVNPDKDTRLLQSFNARIQADNRVENLLLPIRDGLMIARKK